MLGIITLLSLFAESGGQVVKWTSHRNIWFISIIIIPILGLIIRSFLFAESGGQVAGNLKGNKQNFQLLDVVNILGSVTGTRKVICLLLYSTSHNSDG